MEIDIGGRLGKCTSPTNVWYFSVMTTLSAFIPEYALYGEGEHTSSPVFAHIETIAARSELHAWEIAPHRHHRSLQALIVISGQVELSLDGLRRTVRGPCHVTVPVGAVHGFRFEPDTRGWVLTLGQEFCSRAGGKDDPLAMLLSTGGVGDLSADQLRCISLLAEELIQIDPSGPHSRMFAAMAEAVLRALTQTMPHSRKEGSRIGVFRHLVETHLAEHRPIGFYAESMGMTVRTLNRICMRELGCTPLDVVHRRLAVEAQRLLRYTNASVAQVADRLGFADPSYFSRFYLRVLGRRPAAERAPA